MDLYRGHGQHTNIVVAFRSILNLCVLASFDFLRYGDNFVAREHKAYNASIGQKSHGTEEEPCCSHFTAGTLDLSHEKGSFVKAIAKLLQQRMNYWITY